MKYVSITFEDRIGITNGVYNRTSAVGIPLLLKFDQRTVNVTVCGLNNTSSCHSVCHRYVSHFYVCSFTTFLLLTY